MKWHLFKGHRTSRIQVPEVLGLVRVPHARWKRDVDQFSLMSRSTIRAPLDWLLNASLSTIYAISDNPAKRANRAEVLLMVVKAVIPTIAKAPSAKPRKMDAGAISSIKASARAAQSQTHQICARLSIIRALSKA